MTCRTNGYCEYYLVSATPLLTELQTTAALSWFLLAMAMHPEVQAKAQAELDRIVGPDRLPQVANRDALPYIAAVMRKVFRW